MYEGAHDLNVDGNGSRAAEHPVVRINTNKLLSTCDCYRRLASRMMKSCQATLATKKPSFVRYGISRIQDETPHACCRAKGDEVADEISSIGRLPYT